MNQDQLTTLLRTLLQFGGGIAVGRGWIDAETSTALTGALVTLLVTVWGLYVRRNAGLVASAAALPSVKVILADPATADAVPSPKVRPPT
ncbi:hypothetical protein SAMN02799631_05253 [Methylobacterium sp. 174MFSha1.1]|uniref:Pam3-gp28 family putative phage holin n=1 Tax=Methylobacterium sp. 174MFSha1.1 TaxID=1502749 RepID=UPI0008E40904|nr:hypothetical protein [Methylobacterium sp. 174MFSha1.1]SFV11354.1 hypothetical protein SAMN02799631_05253 [Methylobacterium sp. 174MFSha1.1]